MYEKQLIERTIDACGGTVDIVIDFGTTSRSLHRSIQCLTKNGVVLVSEEVGERLLPKFSSLAEKREVKLHSVANGTIEQLTELVQLVSKREVSASLRRTIHLMKSQFGPSKSGINNNSFLYSMLRLNHHHTQCSHAMMLKRLSVNYANQRFPVVLYSNSTISSNLTYTHSHSRTHKN